MKMGKISELQKLNLDGSKKGNQEKVKVSDGLLRYIEKPSEESRKPPILHIVDSSKSTEITLGFYDSAFVRATIENTNTHFRIAGCSTGNIKESLNMLDFYNSRDLQERNLLIYGAICEALCRAGIPIEPVIADMDILTQFIDNALTSCGINTSAYKSLGFSKVKTICKIKEISSVPLSAGNHQFPLAGEDNYKPKVIVTMGTFMAYLTTSDSKIYEVEIPMYTDDAVEHADVTVAVLWITFAVLHLYVKESISTSPVNMESNIVLAELNDTCITSPSILRSELCCTKRQEEYKKKGQMSRIMKAFK